MNPSKISNIKITIFILIMVISTISFSSPLKVGVLAAGPPAAQKVKTAQGYYYYGFLVDLMNTICQRIKQPCTYHEITEENEFDLLDNNKIDLLIVAKPYNSFNQKQYAYSIPYAISKIQFVTLKGSPINEISDIKNQKIGVNKHSFYDLLIQSSFAKHNEIISYNSEAELLSNLVQNNVDVIALHYIFAHELLIGEEDNNVKLIGNDIPLGDGYGIIALKDKAILIKEISKAIMNIEQDGTFTAIYQKYYKP